ncbi:hypothetical protein D3C84_769630 [compost metagenome]
MLAHVEIGPGDHAADGRAGHDLFRLEVDLGQARAVLTRLLRQPAEAEVAAVAIDLADAGHQVVQVGLGLLVGRVVSRTVFSPTLLPALTLMADLPRRDNVLPLDARGALGVFARHIPAGCEVHLVAGVFAAAIELGGLRGIQLPGDFLGFVEGARGVSLRAHREEQKQQSKTTDTH